MTKENYAGGKRLGEVITYHRDGSVKGTGTYRGGELHGVTKTFNQAGQILTEAYWENNKMVGTTRAWYDDGTLKQIITRSEDDKTMEVEEYFPNGKLYKKSIYDMGELSFSEVYDKKGNLIYQTEEDKDQ